MREFKEEELKKIKGGGQVTIIGGSKLFHGAPILSLKTTSRIVNMVFFASPEPSVGKVAENLKSKLASFIWVPWEEVEKYIKKSDAVLIGPGFMRYHKEGQKAKGKRQNLDKAGLQSKEITERLLSQFPDKQWVIDAGSLQVMDPKFIPKNAILTPNQKEFEMLFRSMAGRERICCSSSKMAPAESAGPARSGTGSTGIGVSGGSQACHLNSSQKLFPPAIDEIARKYQCIIVFKGPETIVYSPEECVKIPGGNAGLTKGGTGDVLAGLTVALAAKNPPLLAACSASYIVKKTAEVLYKNVGFAFNADDLAEKVPEVLAKYF